MRPIQFDFSRARKFLGPAACRRVIERNRKRLAAVVAAEHGSSDALGWIEPERTVAGGILGQMEAKAAEVRARADVFLLIGVGGSDQGARAVIEAIGDGKPEVLYAGNNLSPRYLESVLSALRGRSVYVNVIAKNFATLEPGIVFRVVRRFMEKTFGQKGSAGRIIATGSLNGSVLQRLGERKGYTLLPFPLDVGGRFSVLTPVGLFPIAVAGVDIRALLRGAKDMRRRLRGAPLESNPAVQYAVTRRLLLAKGFRIEMLASFEPALEFFARWWIQLFGESEGKDGKGIFPAACSFSELHSLGQYIQDGPRTIFETFLDVREPAGGQVVPAGKSNQDGFDYLNGKSFASINRAAFGATLKAHAAGGVPCLVLGVPRLGAHEFGQLFYFFQAACHLSGTLLGVNPFDQPGVEAYKTEMFRVLGRR